MALVAGSRLGPYEVLSPVGAGGMAEVYRARDPRLGRDVAIKVLPDDFAADRDRLRRFEQEARAVAALSHPNVVVVHDVGTQGGRPYLVTELLEGETLGERLRHGALPLREAVETAVHVAEGLAAAHAKTIAHRDLKPANVFLTKEGRVKILDFGLARWERLGPEDETASAVTDPGMPLGTVGYMSPEQVRGERGDRCSDIFSFGVLLYEMVSGRHPFRRTTGVETQAAILREEPVALSGLGHPEPLERVILRCLEKRPEDRFHSAHDLALALQSVVPLTPLPPPVARTGWRRRAVAVGVGALVVLAGLGWWLRPTRVPDRPPAPVKITPFTTDGGIKLFPRLSPDGEKVAYTWASPSEGADIYVKPLGPGTRAIRLTNHPDLVGSPAWSPDGRLIAFARSFSFGDPRLALYTVPSLGGTERKLTEGPSYVYPSLSWSPDGRGSVFAVQRSKDEPSRVVRLSLDTLEKRALTSPPEGSGRRSVPGLVAGREPGGLLAVGGGAAAREPRHLGSADGGWRAPTADQGALLRELQPDLDREGRRDRLPGAGPDPSRESGGRRAGAGGGGGTECRQPFHPGESDGVRAVGGRAPGHLAGPGSEGPAFRTDTGEADRLQPS
jgi:serine/threonine protein kinase